MGHRTHHIKSTNPKADTVKAWIADLIEDSVRKNSLPKLLQGMDVDFNEDEALDSDPMRAIHLRLQDGSKIMIGFHYERTLREYRAWVHSGGVDTTEFF